MVGRLALLVALAVCSAVPAPAQAPPLPDQAELAGLVWSTLIALDQANRTGNYTVLRDLGAPGFRQANTAADLSQIFAAIRAQDPGLGRVLSAEPVYTEPPRLTDAGQLYLSGRFAGRPQGISFEMLFEAQGGGWLLFGLSVAPLGSTPAAPLP